MPQRLLLRQLYTFLSDDSGLPDLNDSSYANICAYLFPLADTSLLNPSSPTYGDEDLYQAKNRLVYGSHEKDGQSCALQSQRDQDHTTSSRLGGLGEPYSTDSRGLEESKLP